MHNSSNKHDAHDKKTQSEKSKAAKKNSFFELFWILMTIFLLISIGVIYVFANYFEVYLRPFNQNKDLSGHMGKSPHGSLENDKLLTEESGFVMKYSDRFMVRTFQGDFYFNMSDAKSSGIVAKSLAMSPEFFSKISSQLFHSFELNVTDGNAFGYYASYLTYGNRTIRGDFYPVTGTLKFNKADLDFARKECGELSKDLYVYSSNVTDNKIENGIVGIKFIGNCDKMPIQGYAEFYFSAVRK